MQQGNKEAKGWGAEEALLFKPNWNLSPSVKLGKTEKEFSFKMNRETYGLSGVIFLDPIFFFLYTNERYSQSEVMFQQPWL